MVPCAAGSSPVASLSMTTASQSGSSGLYAKITDFKRAEARVRTLSNEAPVLLCMIDPEDRLIFANRGFLSFFGRTLDDMVEGRWDWTKDIHPDDLPETRQRYFEAL